MKACFRQEVATLARLRKTLWFFAQSAPKPGRGYRLNADQGKRQVGLPPKVFLENMVCSGNSQASVDLADSLYEKLIIALSPRTGIRLITEQGELEEGSYIISGRASVQDGQAKVFISLSESGEAGSFFAEQFKADTAALDRLCEQIASKISNMQKPIKQYRKQKRLAKEGQTSAGTK